MMHVILMEPENAGNIGAVCRVMKNFGFRKLVIINPKVRIGAEARKRAKHGLDILKDALVTDKSYLDSMDTLIATTARLGTDYNIYRSPLTPQDLGKLDLRRNVGLLIGREGSGLHNDEIKRCDFVVTIPSSVRYPTLNISHAVAILLHELFRQKAKRKSNSHILPATRKDKEILLDYIMQRLDKMHFATADQRNTQRIVWRRLVGKGMLTRREVFALIGFFKK
jgi:tRNA/rRNA methyltransferase